MMNDTILELQKLGQEWVAAELKGDVNFLSALLAPDFVGIGPRGFVLTKEQWLGRYSSGSFRYQSLSWEDLQVRTYGASAIVIGKQVQEAAFQGQPSNGQFRGSQLFVKQD